MKRFCQLVRVLCMIALVFTGLTTEKVNAAGTAVTPGIAAGTLGAEDVIIYATKVTDYGADITGEKDSTQAFQAAIDAANASGGGQVFAPSGRYKLAGSLDLPQGITLRGEWKNPDEGGLGKGTILAVYANKNKPDEKPFISAHSAATVRDLSIWYPEQDISKVSSYPYTIEGAALRDQDTVNVINVTLYNAYNGIRTHLNHGCTTVRNLYGTVLNIGIYEDMGFDIGRYENIYFDTAYWANSGLPGVPAQKDINTYTQAHTIGIDMYEDDWGYFYNLNFRNMLVGLQFDDANCAVSKMTTDNVNTALKINRISYPGLQITNSNLKANIGPNPVCLNYSSFDLTHNTRGMEVVSVNNTTFSGAPATAVLMNGKNNPVMSLQNCTFTDWGYGDGTYAVDIEKGTAIIMNCNFLKDAKAIKIAPEATVANILSNTFKGATQIDNMKGGGVNIDHKPIEVPKIPDYQYTFAPLYKPANTSNFFNVKNSPYGAKADGTTDDTSAIQKALDAASAAGGGTVYMPGGTYRMDGSVIVPTGVELRGSFDASHSGKVKSGTVMFVYGGKGNGEGTPLISLKSNASVRGITFFYPEQGMKEPYVYAYPWTVRGLGDNCYATNLALVNAYNGIDMMTNTCNNSVIADMNAYALNIQVQVGKGITGGWLQDVHFNPCNWTQSTWPRPKNKIASVQQMKDYAELNAIGFKLGACKDYNNFQNFTILVKNPIWMVNEPEGSYSGTINGFAFDANEIGLDIEQAGTVNFINPMDVSNLNGGGPNIRTAETFTGTLNYFNGDAWGGGTQICEVNGGTVNLVQYYSWSAPNAKVNAGILNQYATLFMHQGGAGPDCIIGSNAGSAKLIGSIGFPKTNVINHAGSKFVQIHNLNNDGSEFGKVGPFENVSEIALKSVKNGKYVGADGTTGKLLLNGSSLSTEGQFQVESKGSVYALKAASTNKYLCAEAGGKEPLIANRDKTGAWEQWVPEDAGNGRIVLKSLANNMYVCGEDDGSLIPKSATPNAPEVLEVEILSAGAVKNTSKAIALNKLGLFQGTNETSFVPALEDSLTREQAIKIILAVLGKSEEAEASADSCPFKDVSDWAKPYVAYAAKANITKGISDDLFGAQDKVTGRQLATFFLRALGYEQPKENLYAASPKKALNLGLIKDPVTVYDIDREFIRDDLVGISYNALLLNKPNSDKILLSELIDTKCVRKEAVESTADQVLINAIKPIEIVEVKKGEKLDRKLWEIIAFGNAGNAKKAIDGDAASRWDSAAQQTGGEWLIVDLKAAQSFSKIVLDAAKSPEDYPREYEIYVSKDGKEWGGAVSKGKGSAGVTEIAFEDQTARYIKIVQTGTSDHNYWSINELSIIR